MHTLQLLQIWPHRCQLRARLMPLLEVTAAGVLTSSSVLQLSVH
jgi:hypothetical protein